MAYEFDLGGLEGPFTDAENSQIVEFVLGVDPDADMVVVMSIILFPTERPDTLELCFGIRTKVGANLETVSEPDYSKETANLYIPESGKHSVLRGIREAVLGIAKNSKVPYIIMETYYPNLPPKALVKYVTISNELFDADYLVEEEWKDDETGINYWLFKKRSRD